MNTADWALIISLCSFIISLASFIWNVWSKFIYPKARIEVHMSVMFAAGAAYKDVPPAMAIHATNHGPTDVTLHSAIGQTRKWWKRYPITIGILNPYNAYPNDLETTGPFSGGLPKKLTVGEQFSVYLPVSRNFFEDEKLTDFGFHDTFGRDHLCSRKDVEKVRGEALKNPA